MRERISKFHVYLSWDAVYSSFTPAVKIKIRTTQNDTGTLPFDINYLVSPGPVRYERALSEVQRLPSHGCRRVPSMVSAVWLKGIKPAQESNSKESGFKEALRC